jgi:hypothetical protein
MKSTIEKSEGKAAGYQTTENRATRAGDTAPAEFARKRTDTRSDKERSFEKFEAAEKESKLEERREELLTMLDETGD